MNQVNLLRDTLKKHLSLFCHFPKTLAIYKSYKPLPVGDCGVPFHDHEVVLCDRTVYRYYKIKGDLKLRKINCSICNLLIVNSCESY